MDFTPILKNFSLLFKPSSLSQKSKQSATVMILSPHPDDECISGGLALRLMHENGWHVVNVAVTLGSNKDRQKERSK
jgi:LmbE family N-acetylglucosaminyl deacetylase